MKAYLVITGAIFGVLAVLHAWRMVAESHDLATTPWFLALTALAAGLCVWAVVLLFRRKPDSPHGGTHAT